MVDWESGKLVIALAQMDVKVAEPEVNLATAHEMVTQAAAGGAHLVVLPELWGSGYDLPHAAQYATALDAGFFRQMGAWAREYGLHVAGSLLEAGDGRVFNTCALFGPHGLVGSYRKLHLIGLMDEDRYLAPGDRPALCPDLPWGPTGLAICYDLRFPELLRGYGVAGAQLVILPAQWPERRIEHWRVLLRARAIENQCIVAACNRVGADPPPADGSKPPTVFGGASAVIGAWGEALAEGDDQPALLMAAADVSRIQEARDFLPVFRDRRPECYET